jgi:hypothetical protein
MESPPPLRRWLLAIAVVLFLSNFMASLPSNRTIVGAGDPMRGRRFSGGSTHSSGAGGVAIEGPCGSLWSGDRVAVAAQRFQQRGDVLGPTGLQLQFDLDLQHPQPGPQAVVADGHDVRALSGRQG